LTQDNTRAYTTCEDANASLQSIFIFLGHYW
jgi:hypothetical protein